MSRFSALRNHPQLDEIPKPLWKIAILGKSEFTAGLENCWQVYEAQLQQSKEVIPNLQNQMLHLLKIYFFLRSFPF